MNISDIFIIAAVIIAIAMGIMVYVGKKNYAKNLEAQSFISQYKMVTPILIIDKKYERPTADNLPKNIFEKLPKSAKLRKMAIVKAKVGPQITTLMCDKTIYDALVPKKTIKVELAGIYISSIIGLDLDSKRKKSIRERLSIFLSNKMSDEIKK